MEYYEAGHMMYTDHSCLLKMADDAAKFYGEHSTTAPLTVLHHQRELDC